MTNDSGRQQPPSFAALARRISAWTTRGLLTLMVLVAGLGFGRQVLRWWRADTPPNARPLSTGKVTLADSATAHAIEFGDSPWSLRRQSIAGDKADAIRQLRTACRESLDATAAGGAAPSSAADPRKAEAALLSLLAKEKPVAESAGKWRLYELHDAFPLAAGVSWPNTPTTSPRHVLIWGIAMPSGDNEWTLCVFQSRHNSTEGVTTDSNVPLPPDCHTTLSIRLTDGAAITAFQGKIPPDRIITFYAEWVVRRGWRPAVPWRPIGSAWYAKFVSSDRDGGALEIRLGPGNDGGSIGLIMTMPYSPR